MSNVFRGLLRSTVVMGGTQVVVLLLGLVRMKVVALLLGPVGVGVLGIYLNLQSTTVSTAGLGMASSGVRQVAASATGDAVTLSRVRTVVTAAHVLQGLIALIILFFARDRLSVWLFGQPGHELGITITGVAAVLALLATSQTVILQGARRTSDLAKVSVTGAILSTAAAIAAVYFLGSDGLVILLVALPLGNLVAFFLLVRDVGRLDVTALRPLEFLRHWRPMFSVGLNFMLGAFATGATLLVMRSTIAHTEGLDATGYFAAAWGLSVQYMALFLGAMAADYYPRLAAASSSQAMSEIVNHQTQITLLLGGPGLLLLLALAPWIVAIVYSHDFAPAAEITQWQMVGNVLKIASWPLAYVLVARSHGRLFLILEIGWNLLFFGGTWLLLPALGLQSVGIAFFAAYLAYTLANAIVVARLYSVQWSIRTVAIVLAHCSFAGLSLLAALIDPVAGAVIGCLSAVLMLVIAWRLIAQLALGSSSLVDRLKRVAKW